MRSPGIQSFLEKAENRLAGIRASLLLFAQGRLSGAEMIPACGRLAAFQLEAEGAGFAEIGRLATEAAYAVEHLSRLGEDAERLAATNLTLDLISKLEAELLSMPLESTEFSREAGELLDSAFRELTSGSNFSDGADEFEVDAEALEIFREEAEELLANIRTGLSKLKFSPEDTAARWEIRRNIHTLKGAGGIVGLDDLSKLAHSIEDLLDGIVESSRLTDDAILESLFAATARMEQMVSGHDGAEIEPLIADLARLKAPAGSRPVVAPAQADPVIHTPPTPVVRVSLDRLDELMNMSASLIEQGERLAELLPAQDSGRGINDLLLAQQELAKAIDAGLHRVRMVRFGVLDMRLNRAVSVTCQDENKKAAVLINDPDVEVDTLVIDALIEPLLHLLKNAVVHGIEPPETRRLLGKPEKGSIKVGLASDGTNVTISVEDDGRGISRAKITEKAVDARLIDPSAAGFLTDEDALKLIFERGLTTAESVNMNAGRGVGMSIVKESVENRGGSIVVESAAQQGTRFILNFPIVPKAAGEKPPQAGPGYGATILVVDDSQSVRNAAERLIAGTGCKTLTAINGADAFELLRTANVLPDLILSDVEMPVMDGWRFLECLKSEDRFARIPVVMVTSLSEDNHRIRAKALGADDYLIKPLELPEFERLISELVSCAVS